MVSLQMSLWSLLFVVAAVAFPAWLEFTGSPGGSSANAAASQEVSIYADL